MNPVKYKTDYQIRMTGFQVLQKELGVVGLIRFMQQFDPGSGDYVKDRETWQQDYTVDTLTAAIHEYEEHTSQRF